MLKYLVIIFIATTSSLFAAPETSFRVSNNQSSKEIRFLNLMEQVYEWRKKALEFSTQVLSEKRQSGEESRKLTKGLLEYIELRKRLFEYIEKNKNYTHNRAVKINISASGPTNIDQRQRLWLQRQGLSINPRDRRGSRLILDFKQGLIAALALYENYWLVGSTMLRDTELAQLLNYHQDFGAGTQLDTTLNEIAKSATSLGNLRRLKKMIRLIDEADTIADGQFASHRPYHRYLSKFLNSMFAKKEILDIDLASWTKDRVSMHFLRWRTKFRYNTNQDLFQLSKTFGNIVGMVAFREGKLITMPKDSPAEYFGLLDSLQPLDLLLEKTPFRLTDRFIPGHWGHIAIWMGNVEEIEQKMLELDFSYAERAAVEKHLPRIAEGGQVLEALRPGVQLNPMTKFLDIDDLGVVRFTNLSREQQKIYLINAFAQVGKEYDFNFDVNTRDKIVCSELAYIVFEDMDWETDKALGRYTISPDQVAKKALEGPESSELVMLYLDGKRVNRSVEQAFSELIQ